MTGERLQLPTDPAGKHLVETIGADRALEYVNNIRKIAREKNALRTFTPNGKIEELIRAVGANKKKWIFLLPAANSLGKSAAAINILGNLIWGPQNTWFEYERFQKWDAPKLFWYISEKDVLKQFICGIDANSPSELRKWFPKDRYTFEKGGKDYFCEFASDTHWSGSFKTYDQAAEQFEGAKIGVAVFDEPPPEAIYNAVLARMTMGGIILMPMTPLSHSAWTLDRLVSNAGPDSEVFVLYGDIEDNCREHGVRGILSHDQIERIKAQWDQDEIEARAHGRYTHLIGTVYKNLSAQQQHSMEPGDFNQKEFDIYSICDPHDARPPFLAWAAVDRFKRVKVIYEYPNRELGYQPFHEIKYWRKTTRQVAEDIRTIEQGFGWDPLKIQRVMDPNFGLKPNQATGKTVQEQFRYEGSQIGWPLMFTVDVLDNLDAGHRQVRDWLTPDADGNVILQISQKYCQNIWFDMNRYAYDPRQGKAKDKHGDGTKVQMRYKDGADVVRYLVMRVLSAAYIPKAEKPKGNLKTIADLTSQEYVRENIFARGLARAQKKVIQPHQL